MPCNQCGGTATPQDDEFRQWARDQGLPSGTVQALLDALCSNCQQTFAEGTPRAPPVTLRPRGASA